MKVPKHSPISTIFIAAVAFIILAVILSPAFDSSQRNGTTREFNDGWMRLYPDGREEPFTDFGSEIPDESVTLIHSLDTLPITGESLGFYNYYSAVTVYNNDIPIFTYGNIEDIREGVLLGNYYSMTDIHTDTNSGGMLRVVFRSSEPIIIYGFDIGSGSALEMQMIRDYLPTLILPIIAVLFLIIILVLSRKKVTKDLIGRLHAWLVVFILNLAVWMLADSQLPMDIGLKAGSVCLVSFETYMLLPVSLMMFLYSYRPRFFRLNQIICYAALANFAIQNILHFTGICSFLRILLPTHILIGAALILSLIQFADIYRRNPDKPHLLNLIGMLALCLSAVVQYLLFFDNPSRSNSNILIIGALVFTLFQIQNVLSNVNDRIYAVNVRLELRNKQLRETFGSFIPEEIAQAIVDSPEEFNISGSTHQLTVLQSDIRGFSELIQTMCAQNAIAMLNHYLEAMTIIIMRHGGTIMEFVGDGIIATFDRKTVGEQHADKAIFAAVEMQICMEDINHWNKEQGYPEFEMGIGINTGDAYVGYIGSKARLKYDAIGSTINLVSRIESYSTGGQILISEKCRNASTLNLLIADKHSVLPKGFYEREMLYLLAGIGEPYNLEYGSAKDMPQILDEPVPVQFFTVQNKHCGDSTYTGTFTALSDSGALMLTDCPLMLFDNIRITSPMVISAKIISKSRNGFLMRFTSVSKENEIP